MSRALGACLSVLALAGLLGGCGDTGLQTERPPRAQSSAVIWACGPRPLIRPRSFVIACADGNTALAGLHWEHWGAETATAHGRMIANPCTPNCAASRPVSWPVDVTVADLVIGAHHAAYGTVTMTARGHHPPGTAGRLRRPLQTSSETGGS